MVYRGAEYRWSLLTTAVSCSLHVRLTLSGSGSNCRCIRTLSSNYYYYGRYCYGSVGDVSRSKPMDARQQPILASSTNVLEAVLQKHSPSRKSAVLLLCCSSSPNSTPPSMPETVVSTMHNRWFSPKPRSPPPHTAVNGYRLTACTIHCGRQWPSIDMSHTLLWAAMAVD